MTDSTLVARFNSIILSLDTLVRRGLSTLAMNDRELIDKRITEIEGAIEFTREQRSRLDTALTTLEEMLQMLRASAGGEPLQCAPQIENSEQSASKPSASDSKKLLYYYCDNCENYYLPRLPHKCDGLRGQYNDNHFDRGQLDIAHGEGGWEGADPPEGEKPEPASRTPWRTEPVEPDRMGGATPRADDLREGSKKHKIYVATRNLLEAHTQMHVDAIFGEMDPELFAEVKSDKRMNLSNILSQLKSKGLLISDHRGNWSLPIRKTPE